MFRTEQPPILNSVLFILGKWGPVWLIVYGFYCLYNQWDLLLTFVGFVLFNDILNRTLKQLIREERPRQWTTDKTHFLYYGMPSGHAQHAFFVAAFLLLANNPNLYFLLPMCVVILLERVYSRQHTIKQVFVGSILGIGLAFLAHRTLNEIRKIQ